MVAIVTIRKLKNTEALLCLVERQLKERMTICHSRILPGSGRSRVGSGPEVSSLDALQPWRRQWEEPVPPDSAPHFQGGREASDSSLPADRR